MKPGSHAGGEQTAHRYQADPDLCQEGKDLLLEIIRGHEEPFRGKASEELRGIFSKYNRRIPSDQLVNGRMSAVSLQLSHESGD